MFDFQKGRIFYCKGGNYPNCHSVFVDDDVRVLIDPACDEHVLKKLIQEKPIDVIINSHCHEDHFLNNYLFPNAELWTHELEAPKFEDIEAILEGWFEPEDLNGKNGDDNRNYLREICHYQERKPNRLLTDKEIINLGHVSLQVIHTPGHTPGHLSFYFIEDKVLYTADLDLVKAGPYYGDKESSIDDIIHSLQKLAKLDVETYLTAHGKIGVYDGNPKHIEQYLNTIYQREERLMEALAKSAKTIEEITDLGIIYRNRGKMEAWDLSKSERRMMLKHLQRLDKLGRVYREDNRYYLR